MGIPMGIRSYESMVIDTRPDWDALIWRIARIAFQLHEDIGDREALLLEKANLWREAEAIGLFRPKYRGRAD